MSINLIEESKNYLKNSLFSKASMFLDEKIEHLKDSADLILPLLFVGIIQKCEENSDDVTELYYKIKYSAFNSITNFEEIFNGGNSLIFDESYNFHKNIFDRKSRDVIDVLHENSKLHKDSVFSLLKMIIPIVVKTIGSNIKSDKLTTNKFAQLITSQKKHIPKSVTAGFLYKMVNDLDLYTIDFIQGNQEVNFKKEESGKLKKHAKKIIKGASILAVLGLIIAIFYFLNKNNKVFKNVDSEKVSNDVDSLKIVVNTVNNTNFLYNPTQKVIGKYIRGYEFLGVFKEHTLKDGSKIIILSEGGLNNLINHIKNDSPISKQAWYDLYGIKVLKDDATIDFEKSKVQLDAIARILKIYKNIEVKVGVGTDNVGSSNDNFNKSYTIAELVMKELVKRGVSVERLRFEGYGEKYNKFSNDNPTKRHLNNRVIVRLTKK